MERFEQVCCRAEARPVGNSEHFRVQIDYRPRFQAHPGNATVQIAFAIRSTNGSVCRMKMFLSIIGGLGLGLAAGAAPQTFDFKDPKTVNNVVFKTDAPLESINGTATGISGTVTFDPADPGLIKGKIVVEAASLTVPNAMMQGHLRSDLWLDVAKFPQITFEALSASNVKTSGNQTSADITGTMTIKGISHKVTVPVKISYLKDRLKDRIPNVAGDLLVLRGTFVVKRSDYGINKGNFEDKVSDEIELTLSLAGQSPH
jgi:polyisoprenoid-binding protein YceI